MKTLIMIAVAVSTTAAGQYLHWSPLAQMLIAAIGIIPVAALIGESTEHISHRVGPTLGGLINAMFANAPELIIAIAALNAGLVEVVKASITGSIIANMLMVLGASFFFGGLKHGEQRFDRDEAVSGIAQLALVAFMLLLPAAMVITGGKMSEADSTHMALAISALLIVAYCHHVHSQLQRRKTRLKAAELDALEEGEMVEGWSIKKSLIMLAIATGAVVYLSEVMVGTVEEAAKAVGMTPVFIGVILLAIVGNAAENSTAVFAARKNNMDLSMSIVLSSSTQIATLVAPVLVIVGYFCHQPMDFAFSGPEVIAVLASVSLAFLLVSDGKSTQDEGVKLICMWGVSAICFFFLAV
jgi:Ca2+:H+ antiporter